MKRENIRDQQFHWSESTMNVVIHTHLGPEDLKDGGNLKNLCKRWGVPLGARIQIYWINHVEPEMATAVLGKCAWGVRGKEAVERVVEDQGIESRKMDTVYDVCMTEPWTAFDGSEMEPEAEPEATIEPHPPKEAKKVAAA